METWNTDINLTEEQKQGLKLLCSKMKRKKNTGKASERHNQDDQGLQQLLHKDQERDAAASCGHQSPACPEVT